MIFSVIVANYNNSKFIPALIRSLINQTFTEWELVIADDASTDESCKIIQEYALKDERIKLVRHRVNLGAGAAFKSAMDASRGSIIGMLGADDALVPNALERMIRAHIEYPYAGVINSQSYDCDIELNVIKVSDYSQQPKEVSFLDKVYVGNFVTFSRKAYTATDGFNPLFRRAVDTDLYLKLEEVGSKEYVNEPLYLYRRHDGGISQGSNGIKAAHFALLAKIHACNRRLASGDPSITEEKLKSLKFTYYTRKALYDRKVSNYSESLKSTLQSIALDKSYLLNRSFWTSIFYNVKDIIFK